MTDVCYKSANFCWALWLALPKMYVRLRCLIQCILMFCGLQHTTGQGIMLYSAFAGGFSYKNAASFCRRRQLQKRVECKFNQGVYAHLCKFCSALHHLPTKQYSMYNIVRTAHVKMLVLFHMYCDSVFSQNHKSFQNIPIPLGVQISLFESSSKQPVSTRNL